jgi:hypothetical protein
LRRFYALLCRFGVTTYTISILQNDSQNTSFSSIIFDFIFRKIFPENFESQALENAHFLGF